MLLQWELAVSFSFNCNFFLGKLLDLLKEVKVQIIFLFWKICQISDSTKLRKIKIKNPNGNPKIWEQNWSSNYFKYPPVINLHQIVARTMAARFIQWVLNLLWKYLQVFFLLYFDAHHQVECASNAFPQTIICFYIHYFQCNLWNGMCLLKSYFLFFGINNTKKK